MVKERFTLSNILRKKKRYGPTSVYFHNFRNQRIPDSFDVLEFKNSSVGLKDVFGQIKAILKVNKNTPMRGYAIRNIKKLKYSWLYKFHPTGYGPKRNFKPLPEEAMISCYEHILVNYHHSQFNEDYIIEKIFERIKPSNKYFVEFGAGDGETISNTILLRYNGWRGLLIEAGSQLPSTLPNALCVREFATPDNIEVIFEKAGVPEIFDFLSIDIDGNDYYVWKALERYRPRVLCIEVDEKARDIRRLGPYDEESAASKCSILVMTELCEKKGYKLIYNNGGNAFYVNNKDYSYFKPKKDIKGNEPFVATVDL